MEPTSEPSEQPVVQLVSWTPQAIYSPTVDVDDCTICKQTLTLQCSNCQESSSSVFKPCPASLGKCGHCFHYHCIKRWVNEGGGLCPIDKTEWKERCKDCSYSDRSLLVSNPLNAKKITDGDTKVSMADILSGLKTTTNGPDFISVSNIINTTGLYSLPFSN